MTELLPHHRRLIETSAISEQIAAERGYFSVSEPRELNGMFGPSQRLAPALVIPIFNAWGEKVLYQLRPDTARVVNGRVCKYETPRGSGLTIDVPPSTRLHLGNPKVPLIITEGVRKADAAASIGLRAIDLLGVWGFRGRNEDGGITTLDDWHAIALNNDRPVYICFDSDAMTKAGVYAAVVALGRFLGYRGAKLRVIYLPHAADGRKTGLDDFLAAGHTRDDLLALASDTLRPLASDPQSNNAKPPEGPLLPTGELLSAVVRVLDRYVRLPSRRAALALALWVAHTWAFEGAHATPYLVLQSATKRSGKTRLEETLELLVREPWRIAAASESAMFRRIADQRPTLLLDEVDAIFGGRSENTESLRSILNAGNRPGAAVARTVGEGANLKSVDFPVYCPKVLAGIGTDGWPDTILDRAIRITLARKKGNEIVARFRHRKAHAETEELRTALAAWAAEHAQTLHDAEPELPLELDDRAAEGWEALFAIADLADAELAKHARAAAVGLAREAPEDEDGHGVLLLKTLRGMFADVAALQTEVIVTTLNAGDEAPFGTYRKGLGIDSRGLARLLRPFGIRPKVVRIDDRTPRGYQRDQFTDAWDRYCPEPDRPTQRPDPPDSDSLSTTSATTASPSQKTGIFYPQQMGDVADDGSTENPHSDADVTHAADQDPQTGGEHANGEPDATNRTLADQAAQLFDERLTA